MSTFMPKAETVERKWYILDAAGKPLGRVAAKAAHILRGKHKPTYAPHCDCGDHVIIINCAKAVLTGNKLENKYYRWHTGYIGGLKEVQYSKLMSEKPEKAMQLAIEGMLPNNTLGRKAATRMRLYAGRRKHSVARVRVYPGSGVITVNGRGIDDYFGLETLKLIVRQPLALTGTTEKFDIVCTVAGGGVTGQAGAIRHGLSRALLQYSDELRPVLKKAGFLTRDPRMKERKKYGLKAARRAPQFSKR